MPPEIVTILVRRDCSIAFDLHLMINDGVCTSLILVPVISTTCHHSLTIHCQYFCMIPADAWKFTTLPGEEFLNLLLKMEIIKIYSITAELQDRFILFEDSVD